MPKNTEIGLIRPDLNCAKSGWTLNKCVGLDCCGCQLRKNVSVSDVGARSPFRVEIPKPLSEKE